MKNLQHKSTRRSLRERADFVRTLAGIERLEPVAGRGSYGDLEEAANTG